MIFLKDLTKRQCNYFTWPNNLYEIQLPSQKVVCLLYVFLCFLSEVCLFACLWKWLGSMYVLCMFYDWFPLTSI